MFYLSILLSGFCLVPTVAPRPPPAAFRRPELIRAGPVDSTTSARSTLLFAEAEKFVREKSGGQGIAELAELGCVLYDSQGTQGELKETILTIQDRYGYAKPATSAACGSSARGSAWSLQKLGRRFFSR